MSPAGQKMVETARDAGPPSETVSPGSAKDFVKRAARGYLDRLPVGRWGVPVGRRGDVMAICAFAATAEDRARAPEFEGRREAELDSLADLLETCAARADHPVFAALGETIRRRRIPIQPFRDMLAAARLDAAKHRYETLDELADYCRLSSCPAGRLALHLADNWDAQAFGLMDALCTGAALSRLWRNISVDHAGGRSYVPRREAAGFGVDVDVMVTGRASGDAGGLVRQLVTWSRGFFEISRPLMGILKGAMRFDAAAAWHKGTMFLDKTYRLGPEALDFGSALTLPDRLILFWRALSGKP